MGAGGCVGASLTSPNSRASVSGSCIPESSARLPPHGSQWVEPEPSFPNLREEETQAGAERGVQRSNSMIVHELQDQISVQPK